jgi:hypothetical protein
MYDYDSLRGRSIYTDHRAIASTILRLHQIWYHYSQHNKGRLEKPNKGDRDRPYPAVAVGALGHMPAGPSGKNLPKKPKTWGEIVFSSNDHAGALADRDSRCDGAHGLCSPQEIRTSNFHR